VIEQVGETQKISKMITELKLSMLTSNLEGLNNIVDEQNEKYESEKLETQEKINEIKSDLDKSIRALEAHYHSSDYKV